MNRIYFIPGDSPTEDSIVISQCDSIGGCIAELFQYLTDIERVGDLAGYLHAVTCEIKDILEGIESNAVAYAKGSYGFGPDNGFVILADEDGEFVDILKRLDSLSDEESYQATESGLAEQYFDDELAPRLRLTNLGTIVLEAARAIKS